MTPEHPSAVSFSDTEPTELAQYRSVSRLALIGLALGVTSASALALPLLVALAAAGTVVAVVALRAIANSQGMLVGRGAALAGLGLSLFFASWVVVMQAADRYWAFAEARPRAEQWIELVRAGRLQEAHQLALRQEERQTAGADLAAYYEKTKKAQDDMNSLFQMPAPQKIVAVGRQGTLRFVEDVRVEREPMRDGYLRAVTQRFALESEENGRPVTLKFLVTMAVTVTAQGEARWQVRSVTPA